MHVLLGFLGLGVAALFVRLCIAWGERLTNPRPPRQRKDDGAPSFLGAVVVTVIALIILFPWRVLVN